MYTDYYLRFGSVEQLMSEWPWMDGFHLLAPGAVDVVGRLRHEDKVDENGLVIEQGKEIDGYHVNLRLRSEVELPDVLVPYIISVPEKPKHVFA